MRFKGKGKNIFPKDTIYTDKDKWHLFIQILFWFDLTKDKSKKTLSSHICLFICGLNWMQDQGSPSPIGQKVRTTTSEEWQIDWDVGDSVMVTD